MSLGESKRVPFRVTELDLKIAKNGNWWVQDPVTQEAKPTGSKKHKKKFMGRPVYIAGQVFSSVTEAAKTLGLTVNVATQRVRSANTYKDYFYLDSTNPAHKTFFSILKFRGASFEISSVKKYPTLTLEEVFRLRKGCEKPVCILGKYYPSSTVASEVFGVCPATIKNWLNSNDEQFKNCYYLSRNPKLNK